MVAVVVDSGYVSGYVQGYLRSRRLRKWAQKIDAVETFANPPTGVDQSGLNFQGAIRTLVRLHIYKISQIGQEIAIVEVVWLESNEELEDGKPTIQFSDYQRFSGSCQPQPALASISVTLGDSPPAS